MKFFCHKDLGNHLLQLCPKVVKHPVYELFQPFKRTIISLDIMTSPCILADTGPTGQN